MELQGKVIAVLPERSGVSARGEWKSQQYVIETHDQYPRKLVFDIFGADKIEQFAIKSGEEILVSFDIDAHEYNGRWFNNIRAWKVEHIDAAAAQAGYPPAAATPDYNTAPVGNSSQQSDAGMPFSQTQDGDANGADDLPF